MAWIRSKNDRCFNVLRLNTAGRDIIRRAPQMSDQQLEQELDHYFHNKGWRSGERVEPKQVKQNVKGKESIQKEVPNVRLTKEHKEKITKTFSPLFKKQGGVDGLINKLDSQDDNVKSLFNGAINEYNIVVSKSKGSSFSVLSEKLTFNPYTFKDEFEAKDTVFHEVGHSIDYKHGKNKITFASSDYVSKEYNVTLKDSLLEEGKKLDFRKIEKEEYSKRGYYKDFADMKKEMADIKAEKKELSNLANSVKKTKLLKENEDKYQNVYAKVGAVTNDMQKSCGSLSDMSMAFSGKVMGNNTGHSKKYFVKESNGSIRQSEKEFFAETFSSKINNKESYELTKKYFPRTTAIFEEILKVKGVSK